MTEKVSAEVRSTADEPDATGPAVEPAVQGRGRRAVTAVVAVVLALSVVAAVVLGTLWVLAEVRSDPAARARDEALAGARQAAINLTTVDSTDVAGTLESWGSVVTGDLEANYAETRVSLEQQISASAGRTEVTIVDAALTELDVDAGAAGAVIFADVVRSSDGQEPATQRYAVQMTVQRTDDGWKASALDFLAQPGGAVQ